MGKKADTDRKKWWERTKRVFDEAKATNGFAFSGEPKTVQQVTPQEAFTVTEDAAKAAADAADVKFRALLDALEAEETIRQLGPQAAELTYKEMARDYVLQQVMLYGQAQMTLPPVLRTTTSNTTIQPVTQWPLVPVPSMAGKPFGTAPVANGATDNPAPVAPPSTTFPPYEKLTARQYQNIQANYNSLLAEVRTLRDYARQLTATLNSTVKDKAVTEALWMSEMLEGRSMRPKAPPAAPPLLDGPKPLRRFRKPQPSSPTG